MIVKLDKKALKDLSKINRVSVQKILAKIEKLESFPQVSNFKKLTNFKPPFRLRVGDYRILFDVEENVITVYRVRHRKESYK